jgi:hypothetical protein
MSRRKVIKLRTSDVANSLRYHVGNARWSYMAGIGSRKRWVYMYVDSRGRPTVTLDEDTDRRLYDLHTMVLCDIVDKVDFNALARGMWNACVDMAVDGWAGEDDAVLKYALIRVRPAYTPAYSAPVRV